VNAANVIILCAAFDPQAPLGSGRERFLLFTLSSERGLKLAVNTG
jgi:hypothetical protein